jgi:hypothetical protein
VRRLTIGPVHNKASDASGKKTRRMALRRWHINGV